MCLPCAKKIINGQSLAYHAIAEQILAWVNEAAAAGKMDKGSAETILNAMIDADKTYMATMDKVIADFLASYPQPW